MPDTLCWSCANACGGCSWSKTGTYGRVTRIPAPVPGWTAIPSKIRDYKRREMIEQPGYIVLKCPQYKPDREV